MYNSLIGQFIFHIIYRDIYVLVVLMDIYINLLIDIYSNLLMDIYINLLMDIYILISLMDSLKD